MNLIFIYFSKRKGGSYWRGALVGRNMVTLTWVNLEVYYLPGKSVVGAEISRNICCFNIKT